MDPQLQYSAYNMFPTPYSFAANQDTRTATGGIYRQNLYYMSQQPFDRSGFTNVPSSAQRPTGPLSMKSLLEADPLGRSTLPRRVRQLFEHLKSSASVDRLSMSQMVNSCRTFFSRLSSEAKSTQGNPLYQALDYLEILHDIVKTREDFLLQAVTEAILTQVEVLSRDSVSSIPAAEKPAVPCPVQGGDSNSHIRTQTRKNSNSGQKNSAAAEQSLRTRLASITLLPNVVIKGSETGVYPTEPTDFGQEVGTAIGEVQTGRDYYQMDEILQPADPLGELQEQEFPGESLKSRSNNLDHPWVSSADEHIGGYDFFGGGYEEEDDDSELGEGVAQKRAQLLAWNAENGQGEMANTTEPQHIKDPVKEQAILKLMDDNHDILAKANLNRKKKRAIINALRVAVELTRKTLRDIVTEITLAEPTEEDKKKFKAKKSRMEERMKEKKEKLKAMTKEEKKVYRQAKKLEKESAIGNLIRGGFQILSKQLADREGVQPAEIEPKSNKKRKRVGSLETDSVERADPKKSRRKEELTGYLDVLSKDVKLKVVEDNEQLSALADRTGGLEDSLPAAK